MYVLFSELRSVPNCPPATLEAGAVILLLLLYTAVSADL